MESIAWAMRQTTQQQNTSVFISCSLTVKNMIKIDSSWRPCKPRTSFLLLVLFVFFFANVANVVTPPPLPPLWTVQEFQTHGPTSNWILTCATHNPSPLKSHSVTSSLQLLGSYPCHMILNLCTQAHYPSRCPTVWAFCFIIILVAMLEAWGSFERPHHFCIARSGLWLLAYEDWNASVMFKSQKQSQWSKTCSVQRP